MPICIHSCREPVILAEINSLEMSWCEESVRSYPCNCCSRSFILSQTSNNTANNPIPVNITIVIHIHTVSVKHGAGSVGERALLCTHTGELSYTTLVQWGKTTCACSHWPNLQKKPTLLFLPVAQHQTSPRVRQLGIFIKEIQLIK